MAMYDRDAPNAENPYAQGALEPASLGTTLYDISKRDGVDHYAPFSPGLGLYGFTSSGTQGNTLKGYQIAAAPLMDGCFRYVFATDGKHLIRYKLTEDDLEFDNYWFNYGGGSNNPLRTEMELTELPNGNYRIAIPGAVGEEPFIKIYDLDADFEVIASSEKLIDLGMDISQNRAEPIGLEFDQNGRYLYFTHEANANFPQPIDVYDCDLETIVTPSALSSTGDFRKSYIERYDNELFLVTEDAIASIQSPSSPGSVTFNSSVTAISNYGNTGQSKLRYQLPAQIDNEVYGNFESFSCACCKKWADELNGLGVSTYTATVSETWTPTDNPLNNGAGPIATVREELRIQDGVQIEIVGMEVRFMPIAKCIVERATSASEGGELKLNQTTFTVNSSCTDNEFADCAAQGTESCDENRWLGIRVEGYANEPQSLFAPTKQGRVIMENGAKIEHANVGIYVGSPSAPDYGGGVLDIVKSEFVNNVYGIRFDSYVSTSSSGAEVFNVSRIHENNFIADNDFILGGSISNPFGTPPVAQVKIINSSGIRMRGNQFINSLTLIPSFAKGNAIAATNSRITVTWKCETDPLTGNCLPGPITQSSFVNFKRGVDVFNSSASMRKIRVEYSNFSGNQDAIYLRLTQNAEVLDNNVVIPRTNGARGLILHTSTGYDVQNNTFEMEPGSIASSTTGILVHSSGGDANEIYRNFFSDLETGIQTQGQNAQSSHPYTVGLTFKCNTFNTVISESDIYVRTGNISRDQGFCIPLNNNNPAGNLFSQSNIHTPFTSHFDFLLDPVGSTPDLEVNYRHHTPVPSRLAPNVLDPTRVQLNDCAIAFNFQESCPIKKSGDPKYVSNPGPKSGELAESDLDFNNVYEMVSAFETEFAESAAIIDNGHTAALLRMIELDASAEELQPVLDLAGTPLSSFVLGGLTTSGSEMTNALASAPGLDSFSADEVEYTEDELEWLSVSSERASFWGEIIDLFQSDTTGQLTWSQLHSLFDEFQPSSHERMASSLAHYLGMEHFEWIKPSNSLVNMSDLSADLDSAESLSYDVPELFEDDFFDDYSNAVTFNQAYLSAGQDYHVYRIPQAPIISDADPKSSDMPMDEDMVGLKVYPNPFGTTLNFDFASSEYDSYDQIEIIMYDITGRTVYQKVFGGDKALIVISESTLPRGVILYQVIVDGVPYEKGKVVRIRD